MLNKAIINNEIPERTRQSSPLLTVGRCVLGVFLFALFSVFFVWEAQAKTSRIKDIVDIEGVRDNQLVGYGLVVGLNGTDSSDMAVFQ